MSASLLILTAAIGSLPLLYILQASIDERWERSQRAERIVSRIEREMRAEEILREFQ